MATVEFEAWLDQSAPIEIATPIYQRTTTTINFTVLALARTAKSLTSYAVRFVSKFVDSGETAFAKTGTILVAANGTCKVDLTTTDLVNAGECVGSLNLYSGGSVSGPVTDRVLFRFSIQEAVE